MGKGLSSEFVVNMEILLSCYIEVDLDNGIVYPGKYYQFTLN